MFGWFLSQQGGEVQFWILFSVPWDQLQDPSPALLWEVGLSPNSHSQPLWLFQPLLGASLTPLGGWLITPPPFSAFVAFPEFIHWQFCDLPPSPFSWAGSVFHPHLCCWCYITIFSLCFSVLFGGWFNLPRGCTGLCSWGVGRGVARGVWCLPIHSADSYK
jgi:hypothetical protein